MIVDVYNLCVKMESLKLKANQVPSRAHRLFIQLYCERKGENNKKTIQEAKSSWMSLSISKKNLFYKTTTDRNLLNYAYGLSKSKIYLKKRISNSCHEISCNSLCDNEESELLEPVASIDENCSTENILQLEENELVTNKPENSTRRKQEEGNLESHVITERSCDDSSSNLGSNMDGHMFDSGSPNQMDAREDALDTQNNTSIQGSQVLEPTPPTVKIGKDLYEMIKQPGSLEWRELSKTDRNHYHTAVRAIKREYIKKYTKYLESLSQQQLFDHYMKTLH